MGRNWGQVITVEMVCRAHGLPIPEPEFRFHPDRKFRFDWAWPHALIALEVNGGAWTQGRHTRGAGFLRDMDKLNAAQLLGWTVLQCTPGDVTSGKVADLLKQALL